MINKVIRFSFSKKFYDISVVGGGLVGLSFVNGLLKNPYFQDKNILIIDKTNIYE